MCIYIYIHIHTSPDIQKGLVSTGHIVCKQLPQESDAERLHRMMKADNDSVTRVQFIAPWNVVTWDGRMVDGTSGWRI